jgi:hypothetical protein
MTFGVSPNPERRQRNRALTAVMDDSAMALTAEEHAQLAAAYEKAAGDCLIPLEQQAAFARKANCVRILARLAEKNEQAARQVTMPPELLRPTRSRLGSAFKRLFALVS